MAQDVEAAIDAAVGEAATGLVMIIAPDFGGDFAELARGLATSALAHKSLVKLAVVVDPEQMDGATLNSFEARRRIRQFARADENARSNGRPRPARGVARSDGLTGVGLPAEARDSVRSFGFSWPGCFARNPVG